jgi:hypothetical protein
MILRAFASAAVLALAFAGAAHAASCGGEPQAGVTEFRGPVLEVLDGNRICVALGPDPSAWAPVRLADGPTKASTASPSRGALMAASFGQDVTCRIVGRDEHGVVAECASDRGSLTRLAQQRRVIKAGQTWR